MNECSRFEDRLTEWLAGELDRDAARAARLELRRHAERCTACATMAGWIELAELPPGERDPGEQPPEGYWEGFNAAVLGRIRSAPELRPAAWWRPLAAAAVIVLALTAGWVLRGRLRPDDAGNPAPGRTATGEWSRLEEAIREATPEELADALSRLPGSGWDGYEADVRGEWLPDAEELDETDQQRLIEWLDQLDQTEGRPTS